MLKLMLGLAAGLLLAAAPGPAVIENSGAAHLKGFRIEVAPGGAVVAVDGGGRHTGHLSLRLTRQFFSHLNQARPLAKLPVAPCGKSVRHNTRTVLRFAGEQSPDLSCPGDERGTALMADVVTICGLLGIQNYAR